MTGGADHPAVLLRAVEEATGLRATTWRDLGGTATTNVAMSTAGGTVVVRIHPASTSLERVAAEQAARRELAAAGVPAVVALSLSRLADGRPVEVEPLAPAGAPMRTLPRLVAGVPTLARVHQVLSSVRLPSDAAQPPVRAHHIAADDAVAAAEAAAARVQAVVADDLVPLAADLRSHVCAVAELESALGARREQHITHGDFWDDNVLLRGEEVSTVLDLGFMARRPRVEDLALPFWFWLLEPGHGPPGAADVELLVRLADAYDRGADQPLDPEERRALPLAVARRPAWSARLWSVAPDAASLRAHATRTRAELDVAGRVLSLLPAWQAALTAGAE